jgi:tetratricopeptide (TPR) repeat protein
VLVTAAWVKSKAIEDYTKAIQLNLQSFSAYHNRRSAYNALGEHQRAIKKMDEALRFDP